MNPSMDHLTCEVLHVHLQHFHFMQAKAPVWAGQCRPAAVQACLGLPYHKHVSKLCKRPSYHSIDALNTCTLVCTWNSVQQNHPYDTLFNFPGQGQAKEK